MVIYLGGQLALTPVLLHFWGKSLYAQWLILYAIPAYFALSDAGIANSFGNALAIAVEQKRYLDAVRMARSVWFWQLIFWAVVFVGMLVGLFLLPLQKWMALQEMPYSTFLTVAVILGIYSLCSLQGGFYTALFRAGGEYAHFVRLQGHLRIVEVLAHGLVAVFGGGLVLAAAAMLIVRGLFYIWCHQRREQLLPGLSGSGQRPWGEFVALLPNGLGFLAFPMGNALINQGASILLKHLAGSGEVVVLNAGRQIARLFLNAVGVLFQSVHPELSVAFARRDFLRMTRLQAQALGMVLWASPVFIVGMALVAPWAISLWTGGNVILTTALAAALAAESCSAGLGNVAMLAGWATNRLRELWVSYLVTQALALAFAWWMFPTFGLLGLLLSFAFIPLAHAAVALWVAADAAQVQLWSILRKAMSGDALLGRLRQYKFS